MNSLVTTGLEVGGVMAQGLLAMIETGRGEKEIDVNRQSSKGEREKGMASNKDG